MKKLRKSSTKFLVMSKIRFFVILIVAYLLSNGCAQRERDNVFDPQSGIDTLNISFYFTRADSLIVLRWLPPQNVTIKGFHLFRKRASEKDFHSRAILPDTQFTFQDTVSQFDELYSYYLTLIGETHESPPTATISTIPGPGTIWILDRWAEQILKQSYDLQHTFLSHYAIWIPQELAFNHDRSRALITYPLFHYAELIDTQNGRLIAEITNIQYPYACAFNKKTRSFWLGDSSGGLYIFNPQSGQLPTAISPAPAKPKKIVFDSNGNAYILDAYPQTILVYNSDGQHIKTLDHGPQGTFKKLTSLQANDQGTYLYIVDNGHLYRYSTLNDSLTLLFRSPYLTITRFSPVDQTVWFVENYQESAQLVQFSTTGIRLNTLSGFRSVKDFAINPINGNLVVADPRAHTVYHLKNNGTLIGKYENAPYPFRVYIE